MWFYSVNNLAGCIFLCLQRLFEESCFLTRLHHAASHWFFHFHQFVTNLSLLLLLPPSGYSRYFNSLKTFLESQPFANDIKIVGKKDAGVTGNFEVVVVESEDLIHSNKKGMGYKMTDGHMNAIAVQIEDALEELSP
jgi:hypothetical protein